MPSMPSLVQGAAMNGVVSAGFLRGTECLVLPCRHRPKFWLHAGHLQDSLSCQIRVLAECSVGQQQTID